MKLALLQLNPTVGDLKGNAEKIAGKVRQVEADLAITSELSLLGYPPRDLLFNANFIKQSLEVLRQLAADLANHSPLLVGFAERNTEDVGRPLFNAAGLLRRGKVERAFYKTL